MKVNVEFEDGDLDPLSDIILSITGEKFSNDKLMIIYKELPDYIKEDVIHWGMDDSVVRDNIYVFLKKRYDEC